MKSKILPVLGKLGIAINLMFSVAVANENAKLDMLKGLTLEELMNVEVTISGRTPQKVADIPSAVYVVSQKDIQKMGARNIPEALKMVPGLHVARIDANKWAVSIRGFNNFFSSNLLVMIDGRSIYTPLFSGVHWDVQGTLMEDIERIEIIRGPGAVIWGANAVNGVINIITKKTENTQGALLSGLLGTEQGIVAGRFGGELSNDASYRLYAKYHNQDNSVLEEGSKASDGWNEMRGGFRMDWQVNQDSQFTVQGDAYQGLMGEQVDLLEMSPATANAKTDNNVDVWGANLLTRWSQYLPEGASQELQVYYDYNFRSTWLAKIKRGTLDFDYRYHFNPWVRHDLVLGAGYRFIHDQIFSHSLNTTRGTLILNPKNNQDHLFSFFIQDKITLIENSVWLTLGSKFEHNPYTGFEVQPSARIHWKPSKRQLLWASVSRALRTPSRAEHDLDAFVNSSIQIQPGVIGGITGNKAFDSEQLIAYEAGYRFQFDDHLVLDFSLFYNDYDKLRSQSLNSLSFPAETTPFPLLLLNVDNKLVGETYGIEVSVDWQPLEKLNLRASYSFLEIQMHQRNDLTNKIVAESYEGQNPEQKAKLLLSYEIYPSLTFDWMGYYVDRLPFSALDGQLDFDLGLRWQVLEGVNLSLYGKNLIDNEHLEVMHPFVSENSTQVEREAFLKLVLEF